MKLRVFSYLSFISLIITFSSCDWLNIDTDLPATDPGFYSLSFAKNDSVPGLEYASFEVVLDTMYINGVLHADSTIVNIDSLPYNTDIRNVIPTYTWNSTSTTYLILKDSVTGEINENEKITLTGTDTINYNRVVMVKNVAENDSTSRTYLMKVNVHKVEPELYVWQKLTDQIFSHSGSHQKAVWFDNKIMLYVSSGIRQYLYTSTEGIVWNDQSASLSNLPTNCNIREIMEYAGKLFLTSDDGKLYSTTDGYSWTNQDNSISWIKKSDNSQTTNYVLATLLFAMNDENQNDNLWAISQSTIDSSYHFATSTDALTWKIDDVNQIPDNFPIGDFSAISFYSRTNQPKALVAGGILASGEQSQHVWSTENGNYWVDFSTENLSVGPLTGASITWYNDKFFLFGGETKNGNLADSTYLVSRDEGLSWSVPDTTYNYLREPHITIIDGTADTTYTYYEPRAYQTVVQVSKDNNLGTKDYYIYLIGGYNQREAKVYSDVWRGKLNRLSFLRQDGD
ncbi:MAG: DUF6242 domain-containing protein [Paludibacter sp.]|nr:DUF6242 domain-containing protein [Paludibacter sp.]